MQEVENQKSVLEITDVSFSYGVNTVLKDITLTVLQGDYLGIIGPNGAGKTTLLKIMLGLLVPSSGSVKLFGKDIRHFKDWPRIGYVPQKATHFDENFPATVYEVALMGRYGRRGLFHSTTPKDRKVTETVLREVDMWEYKDRLIGDLSGGQLQRVLIARALAVEPEIIFLDEPTISIDKKMHDEFYQLLKNLSDQMRLTLVLISHDVEMVARDAKHIACLDRTLVCYGSLQEFLQDTKSSQFLEGVKIIAHEHPH